MKKHFLILSKMKVQFTERIGLMLQLVLYSMTKIKLKLGRFTSLGTQAGTIGFINIIYNSLGFHIWTLLNLNRQSSQRIWWHFSIFFSKAPTNAKNSTRATKPSHGDSANLSQQTVDRKKPSRKQRFCKSGTFVLNLNIGNSNQHLC